MATLKIGTAYGQEPDVDCASGGCDSNIHESQVEVSKDGIVTYHKYPGRAILDGGWNCRILLPNGKPWDTDDALIWSPQHSITWEKPPQADPEWSDEMEEMYRSRESWLGPLLFWPNGKPRIPTLEPAHAERLATGRGVLWEWGEQHAVDSLITRESPYWPQKSTQRTQLQVALVVRRDTGTFACPGGMLPRHHPLGPVGQAKTEFLEEAGKRLTQMERRALKRHMEQQYSCLGTFLSDDPRSTGEAWIATKVLHWHLPRTLSDDMELEPMDDEDVISAFWADFENGYVYCTPEIHQRYPHLRVGEQLPLFASHNHFIRVLRNSTLLPVPPVMPNREDSLSMLALVFVLISVMFLYLGWI